MRYLAETFKKESLFSYQFSEGFSSSFTRSVCQLSFEGTRVGHGCHTWGKTGIDYINVTDKSKMRHRCCAVLYNAHDRIVICSIKRLMTEVHLICLGSLFNMGGGGSDLSSLHTASESRMENGKKRILQPNSNFVWSPIINEKTYCRASVCRVFLCVHWFMKILMWHCASGASLWTQR